MNTPGNAALDVLAKRVLEARTELDARLDRRGSRFPMEEFDRLWQAVAEYAAQMKSRMWLHRDVAREFSGFREYLQLEIFDTPGDALRRADRMEIVLFADYDAYPEDDERPGSENMMGETEHEFGLRVDQCAGCEDFRRIDDLGLCEDCSKKLDRDLIRERDWACSVTAYGLNDEQREEVRRQVIGEFGEGLELVAPSRRAKPKRKRWKGRKRM